MNQLSEFVHGPVVTKNINLNAETQNYVQLNHIDVGVTFASREGFNFAKCLIKQAVSAEICKIGHNEKN